MTEKIGDLLIFNMGEVEGKGLLGSINNWWYFITSYH